MALEGFGEVEGVELLQKLPLFQRLTFEETSLLGLIVSHADIDANTMLIDQNALGDALYVIVKGEAAVTREAGGEGEHLRHEEIGRLRPGDLFGEMSLIDDLLTSARVSAATPMRVLKIPRDKFEQLLAANDKLAMKVYRSFCRTLSERLRTTTTMLMKTQALPVSMR